MSPFPVLSETGETEKKWSSLQRTNGENVIAREKFHSGNRKKFSKYSRI